MPRNHSTSKLNTHWQHSILWTSCVPVSKWLMCKIWISTHRHLDRSPRSTIACSRRFASGHSISSWAHSSCQDRLWSRVENRWVSCDIQGTWQIRHDSYASSRRDLSEARRRCKRHQGTASHFLLKLLPLCSWDSQWTCRRLFPTRPRSCHLRCCLEKCSWNRLIDIPIDEERSYIRSESQYLQSGRHSYWVELHQLQVPLQSEGTSLGLWQLRQTDPKLAIYDKDEIASILLPSTWRTSWGHLGTLGTRLDPPSSLGPAAWLAWQNLFSLW